MKGKHYAVLGYDGIGKAVLEAIGMKDLPEVRRITIDLLAADVATITIEQNADFESVEAVIKVLKGYRWDEG